MGIDIFTTIVNLCYVIIMAPTQQSE